MKQENLKSKKVTFLVCTIVCPACKKYHMTNQEYLRQADKTTMVLVYPNKVVTDIDRLFIEYAPRFVEFTVKLLKQKKVG